VGPSKTTVELTAFGFLSVIGGSSVIYNQSRQKYPFQNAYTVVS